MAFPHRNLHFIYTNTSFPTRFPTPFPPKKMLRGGGNGGSFVV